MIFFLFFYRLPWEAINNQYFFSSNDANAKPVDKGTFRLQYSKWEYS